MQDISAQLDAYRAKYPQDVRDLAETFCASTTRLGSSANLSPARASFKEIESIALRHGVDVETLGLAVDDYAAIESEAAAAFRSSSGNRRGT